ncbi:MAG: transporter substrate-binding domain-containing protein [Methanobacteriota archaeon]|nr:MAG: transporter substrate-binding domain-containing protein [Euryarchaeota archaeon]
MAEGGGAPPAAAMRGAKGVSAVVAVIVAVVTFVAGVGIGIYVLAPAPAAGPPRLVLGTNTPFPPFEYYTNTTPQKLIGFDVELIQTLVTRIGYTYEWRDYQDFTALLASVAANGTDIAIGAITMNGVPGATRNESMKFTDSYYLSNQGVLAKTSDSTTYCGTDNICTPQELDVTGRHVAVQDLTISWTIPTNELYAFAVPKADPLNLVPRLNSALAQTKSDGTYRALLDKYF